jgi:hypothetical protein
VGVDELWPSTAATAAEVKEEELVFACEELWPSTVVELTGVEVGEEGLEERLVFAGM